MFPEQAVRGLRAVRQQVGDPTPHHRTSFLATGEPILNVSGILRRTSSTTARPFFRMFQTGFQLNSVRLNGRMVGKTRPVKPTASKPFNNPEVVGLEGS